ncbi:hypothetical protein [Streptomyces sp. YS-3]|uniref:hypothetical protein n=1 Tax=Streptomyces sp. YS-3 TaxID=3381352 RepID=UPI003862AA26
MVSACGTGKTLIALRTAEALDIRHLLIAVPSLNLIGQWAAPGTKSNAGSAEATLRAAQPRSPRSGTLPATDPDL